jgi:hypothetical protein
MNGLCECGCGQVTKLATRSDRRTGQVKGQPVRFITGHFARVQIFVSKVNALRRVAEYSAFRQAKRRCTNPKAHNWKDYGGRGIKFCFESFEQFLAHIGPRPTPEHSLDRIENDGNYELGNVKWSTKLEQNRNRRPYPAHPLGWIARRLTA